MQIYIVFNNGNRTEGESNSVCNLTSMMAKLDDSEEGVQFVKYDYREKWTR